MDLLDDKLNNEMLTIKEQETRSDPMKIVYGRIAMMCLLITMMVGFLPTNSIGGPSDISGEIDITSNTELELTSRNVTPKNISGSFRIDKTWPDNANPTSARLAISGGEWGASLSQTYWETVEDNQNYQFTVTVMIPDDVQEGDSSTHMLTLSIEPTVGSTTPVTKQMTVTVRKILEEDSGENGEDDNGISMIEDESIPIWPIFIVGILIILVVAGIWSYRNLEMVREVGGKRRIMLREKDSGRIIGKDKDGGSPGDEVTIESDPDTEPDR